MAKKKSTQPKKKLTKRQKRKIKKWVYTIIGLIIVIILTKIFTVNADAAAVVNGEKITKEELAARYLWLSEDYKAMIAVDELLQGMINEKLVLQEADKAGTTVSDEEVDEHIKDVLELYGLTLEDFESQLALQNIGMPELRRYYAKNLKISKFLEQNLFLDIEVTSDEVRGYYEENRDMFYGKSLDAVGALIEQIIVNEKKTRLLNTYVEQLRAESDIKIYLDTDKNYVPSRRQAWVIGSGQPQAVPVQETPSEVVVKKTDMQETEEPVEETFESCIASSGAVLYCASWSGKCENQMAIFSSPDDLAYVDCALNVEECEEAGVNTYPSWLINEEQYIGMQSLESLSGLTGCSP